MHSRLASVVIPVKNGAATLGMVLERISQQQTEWDVEVVVVDSGSIDSSQEIARRYETRLIEIPPHEFDHGETRNLAIRRSHGDLVCLLTQDAIPTAENFLDELFAPFADSRVAGVYGKQIPLPGCDVVTRRNLENWLVGRKDFALSGLEGSSLAELPPMERYKLCVFDNVCAALRRSVWKNIPFPRVDFGEDIHWGRSVVLDGWLIAYQPAAAVHHSHRRSVRYEYLRTRAAHTHLHRLFGLTTLPRRRDVIQAVLQNLRHDLPFTWRHAPRGFELVRQLGRIAALSVASPLAQHAGIRAAGNRSLDGKTP